MTHTLLVIYGLFHVFILVNPFDKVRNHKSDAQMLLYKYVVLLANLHNFIISRLAHTL